MFGYEIFILDQHKFLPAILKLAFSGVRADEPAFPAHVATTS